MFHKNGFELSTCFISVRRRKKHLADVLSLDPCKTMYICPEILFQIIFEATKIS